MYVRHEWIFGERRMVGNGSGPSTAKRKRRCGKSGYLLGKFAKVSPQ
jgi:hypothetical protein